MAARIKKSELTKQEKHLVTLIDEVSFARRLYITQETLRAWCDLSLPFFWYGRERYFDCDAVWDWLYAPSITGDGTNNDLVWSIMPERMLPLFVIFEGHEGVPDGGYWLIPQKPKGHSDD